MQGNSSVGDSLFFRPVHAAGEWPSPVGLTLGLLSVVVGQIVVIAYHFVRFFYTHPITIQKEVRKPYEFWEGVRTHLAQPEGFFVLGSYLVGTWMFNLMPQSYYDMSGSVNLYHVLLQLLIQDAIQTLMHIGEHKISARLYQLSHKPHHKWLNPRLFDAFNGSLADTFFMILVPLFITANLVHCNVWSYMAFGATYATYLTLIHSEFPQPWDPIFRILGVGTPSDHHVHHRYFTSNYGHLFTYWDRILGTYKSPLDCDKFNKDI